MDRYAFDDGHAFGSLRRAQTGIDWLPTGTKHKLYIDNVLIELCERHKDCGNSGHSGRGLLSCELSAATCAIFGSRLRYRRHQDIRLRDREDGRVSTESGSRAFRRGNRNPPGPLPRDWHRPLPCIFRTARRGVHGLRSLDPRAYAMRMLMVAAGSPLRAQDSRLMVRAGKPL